MSRLCYTLALAAGLLAVAGAFGGVAGSPIGAPAYGGQAVPPSDPKLDATFLADDDTADGGDAEVTAMSSCGSSRWDRPRGISSRAPSYLDRRQKDLADDYFRQATRHGGDVSPCTTRFPFP